MKVSYHPAKTGAHNYSGSWDVLSLSRDLTRPSDQRIMLLYELEPLILSHHPTKFGGRRHCGSEYINIPTNTVILPQMRDIRDCLYSLTSAITYFL